MGDVDLGNIFYSIVAKDLTGAGTQSAKGNFVAAGLAIGAAITAIGGAGVAMIDQNNKLMGSIDAISQETGIETDKIRELTMALANGKDSISEVTATMDTLGKFGVTTAEDMDTTTKAALALADANNTTGSDVANNVVPALQMYGLTVDDIGSKSDALTAITHSTKYGLDDVTNILARAGPTASAAGLSFDDMTTMIEAMGLKGVPARSAVSELNTAIKAAAKTSADGKVTIDDLTKSLGMTSAQYDAAKGKIDAAAGSTQAYNKIAEDHVGLMANLSSWWEKTTDNVGQALTPYSSAFTAMTALGGAMTALNGFLMLNNSLHITSAIVTGASTAATTVATAAQWLFDAALDANPIGIIVLAIAGLVAGIVLLDQKFHFIQPTLEWFSNALGSIAGFLRNVADAIMNNPIVGGMINAAVAVGGAIGHAVTGHASGGSMSAGEPGIVGEKGPELFVPSSSGTVIPNGGITTDSSTHIYNITVNASKDYPMQAVVDDVQKLRRNRIAMGIRTGT